MSDIYIEEIRRIPVDSYGDIRTLVRGLPYQCPDDWKEVLESLDEESELFLIKEPDNPKDEMAIAVYLGDRRVGYVAADDNCQVWMFLTDEKTPCRLIQKYEASFKIAFDNPRPLFENMALEDIYKDYDGWIEKEWPIMYVPTLSDKDEDTYDWYRDVIISKDFESMIPDFRRKLASKMITFVARKNSRGRYLYYLPFYNDTVALVDNDMIKKLIDTDGFVIARPNLSSKTYPGGIHIELSVARLKRGNPLIKEFRAVEEKGGNELVFYLNSNQNGFSNEIKDTKGKSESGIQSITSIKDVKDEEYYSLADSPEGGKHVSMGVIVPEEGDENFDFCSYECSISDKKQIDIITNHMKRYEDGKEAKPFLMIGRPCFGLDNIDIFYSMDGEIIFNFIFDEKIKSWIREAGFVLGKVKEYHYFNLTSSLNLTLSVSKRKDGEALFKQASEEAMDYIEEYTSSQADHSVEKRIIDAVKNYITGDSATPYKVIIVPEYGVGTCTTLDGEDVAMIVDGEIIDLAKKNKGVFGYITNYEYDDDGDAWFTIRVSRSIPRLTIEQDSKVSITPTKFNTNLSTAFDDFFPIGGITLGETTWEQAEKLGHEVKIWKEGPCRITHIGDCSFYDFEGIGVFTTLFCHNDFYPSWKSKGFSWDLSYDEWMSVFKKLGYKITVTQQPVKKEFSGHDTLSAEFEAVSPDETLLFRLSFDYGNSGCLTSSPRTLYTVCVKSKKR